MSKAFISAFKPNFDLVIERFIEHPPELVWRGLTEPELVKQWFCPKPWQTVDCRIDLRIGGEFYTVMQSPEGQQFAGASCFLEVIPNERLVWTAALQPGFRPALAPAEGDKECAAINFTCVIELAAKNGGIQYKATVLHGNEAQCKAHEEMGFHEGWGACLEQMVDVLKGL